MTIVLAISRQLGSGGSLIGQAVAGRLGLRYADREILREAAAALGSDETTLESFEERVHGFWDRVAPLLVLGGAEGPYTPMPLPNVDPHDLFEAERRIMREIADRGNAVIVGRGAAHVLRDHPGLLSIFVHAPEAARVRRISEIYHLDPDNATSLIRRSDRQRAAFIESIRRQPWSSATLYDLSVNTESVGLEAATDLVTSLVARRLGR